VADHRGRDHRHQGPREDGCRRQARDGRQEFEAFVTYRYHVNGLPYRGEGTRFGSGALSPTSEWAAAEAAKRHPPGTPERVYYNPKRPEVSVLEPGASFGTFVVLAAGLVFALTGAVALLRAL
jgi:hypothetical protein